MGGDSEKKGRRKKWEGVREDKSECGGMRGSAFCIVYKR